MSLFLDDTQGDEFVPEIVIRDVGAYQHNPRPKRLFSHASHLPYPVAGSGPPAYEDGISQ
jgi:hypothetical protein